MFRQRKKSFVIGHFCCNPTVQADHGMFLTNLGYRVISTSNGFETIQLSTSGKIDAVVLELDRNHSDVLLIVSEIKRVRASIPTVVVAHETRITEDLTGLADKIVQDEIGCRMLSKSLKAIFPGRNQPIDASAEE